MTVTGILFPDLSQFRIPSDYSKAASSGIVAYRGRGGLGTDPWAKTFHTKFSALGVVEIIYSSEGSSAAYDRLVSDIPWQAGILYAADVEAGGMSTAQAKTFCSKPHAVIGYRNPSSPSFGAKYDWLAEYGPAPAGADIWQFTDGVVGPDPHTFAGVGSCDINQCIVSLDTLRQEAGLVSTLDDLAKDVGLTSALLAAAIQNAAGIHDVIVKRPDPPGNADRLAGYTWAGSAGAPGPAGPKGDKGDPGTLGTNLPAIVNPAP